MNAAFLLVTTAWLAGADPTPTAAPIVPVSLSRLMGHGGDGCGCATAPASTCGTCGSCSEHEGLLAKLHARFHRDSCDSCAPAPTCAPKCAPAPVCAPAPTCDTCGEKQGCLAKLKAKFHKSDCGCQGSCGSTSCDSCGSEGPSIFERLKARFHHGASCDGCGSSGGCNSGCGGCGASGPGAPIGAPPAGHGEPLKMPKQGDAPKKLPEGKGTSAPQDIDLTPTIGRSTEVGTPRPY